MIECRVYSIVYIPKFFFINFPEAVVESNHDYNSNQEYADRIYLILSILFMIPFYWIVF